MEEMNKDLAELSSLHAQATRPAIQKMLKGNLDQLISQIEKAKSASAAAASTSAPTAAKPSAVKTVASSAMIPTIKLTAYAWDQSDKFVKIYLPLKNIQSLESKKISHNITARDFEVLVSELDGKNYTIAMKDLLEDVVPEQSQVKQKTDDLLVMLRKKEEGRQWDTLTRAAFLEKEKNKPKFDEKSDDPQAGLMNMMKQMYDTGDDEMKRNIRKAWHEGQGKKGGMGGMPGMPDF